MEEGQVPDSTHIPGDWISFAFEFEHEMNVQRVTATYTHRDNSNVRIYLTGQPEAVIQAMGSKRSKVEVAELITVDMLPGEYILQGVAARTYGNFTVAIDDVPALRFWVGREPRTAPRFRRFIETD